MLLSNPLRRQEAPGRFWAAAALILVALLAAGAGWVLATLNDTTAAIDVPVERLRLTAVFCISLVAVALLAISLWRSRPAVKLAEPPALPWWTDPFGDASFDGVITLDDQALVRSLNHGAEEMFGYASREVTGQSLFRLIPASGAFQGAETLTASRGGDGVRLRVEGVRKDGGRFPVDLRMKRVQRGERAMYLVVCREERAEPEALPVQGPPGRDLLTAEWAGIRQALSTLDGHAGLALGGVDEAAPVRQDLEVARAASDHIGKLARLLEVLGRPTPCPATPADLNDWLRRWRTRFAATAGRGSDVTLELEAAEAMVRMAGPQMEAILNSLAGAGRANGGRRLTVRTANAWHGTDAAWVTLELAGLPAGAGETSLSAEVIRGILARHGGVLEDSNARDQCVRLHLPVVREASSGKSDEAAGRNGRAAAAGAR